MMKTITKLWMTLLLLCVAGVVNAATEYEVDQKFTSVAALDGQMFVIYNETDAKAIYNKDAQNLAYDTYANAVTGAAYLWKLHSLADEGIAELANAYAIEAIKADGTSQSLWGHSPLYLNSGAEGGFDGCFALGNGTQYGTDVQYGGAWEIEYDAEKGFALKNVARGGYFAGVNPAPTGTEPIYWTFCTMKEKAQTDPLAEQKDALEAAIAKGKMINALAYTDATFSTLGTAIADGETALAAEGATAESLTGATTTINDAIAALALKEGFSNLTAEQFMNWDSATEPYSGVRAECSYELFKPSGLPYGDGNVGWNNFALLSPFDKLYVTFTEGTPRIMMNRDTDGGQWNEVEAESHLIEFPKGDEVWSAKYFTNENGVVTVDLKQIIADKGIASLNAIKGANWANVTVTGLFLYKEAVAPAETVATFDFNASNHATSNNGNEGDITTDEVNTVDGVTMTITPNPSGTPNRYWSTNNGPQLRMYGGKMTLVAPEGKAITKVEINQGKWNAGNAFNGEVAATSTWEGNSTNVILEVAGNTQMNSVAVTIADANGETTTYTIPSIANTAETAYTVAEAIEKIEAGVALSDVVFVKGIVSQVDDFADGTITYWISDDGTTANQFECYKGKGIDGADFAAVEDVEVGAEVIVTGTMKKYTPSEGDPIYEFNAGNALVSYNVPVKPLFVDGKYYILNKGAQKYLAAGGAWGTHAALTAEGLDYTIAFADGKYTLDSQVSNGGASNFLNGSAADGPWNDGAAFGWTIEEVSEGVYTINNGTKFIAAGENDVVTFADDATAETAQWTLVAAANRDAANLASLEAATAENGVDATFFIKGANFNRNDLRNSAWTHTRTGGNETFAGPSENRTTYGCEYWNNTFEVSQTIENLPEGIYEFTIAGFATNGTSKIYANETEADFVNTDAGGKNFRQALDAIAGGEFTGNTTGKIILLEGNALKIGVKRTVNSAADWTVLDNARLTFWGAIPAEAFKPAYEDALAAAKAALADEAYAVVTGSEKTALNKAIEDYTTVEETAEAYKAAITALSEATIAFKAAKADYEALINAKEIVKAIDFSIYPYASETKIAAAVAALNAEATSATDAKTKAQTLFNNARKAVESNALLESTYGAVDFNAAIEDANADKKEGWTGNIGTNSNEGYTDGDGVTSTLYLDGGWSSSAGANIDITREVNIPAGKYILTATARGAVDLTEYTMTIAGQTVNLPHIGAGVNDGVFGRGWNDAFVVFEKENDEPATLEIKAISEATQQWMSINRFRLVKFGEAGEEDPIIEAPEGKVNLIANGNLAGENVESFFSKEQGVSADPVASTIVAMAGKNNSRGIVVKSADNPSQAWDTQFWISFNQPLPEGTKLHVEFDYVASKAAKGSTQAHGAPGAYLHWAAIGDVNFTTEWQHFSNDITVDAAMAKGDNGNGSGTGMQSVAFNLAEEKTATEYRFDNFGVWAELPAPIEEWTDIVVNGDMEGADMVNFFATEQGVGGPFVATATEGIGKDGSKAVKVQSADSPTQAWDTQFFVRLPYQLPAGTRYKVSFDYKADKAGDFETQSHAEPGQYIHWAAIGSGSFTTEWQTYTAEGSVPAECDGSSADKTFQTIAFNLAKNGVATEFIFDNVKFEVPANIVETLVLNPYVGKDAAELEAPEGWTKAITNGNLAGDDVTSFVSKEYPSADIVGARIIAGAGKDYSRGIVVKAGDDTGNSGAQAWDSQFWIQLNEKLTEGSKIHIEFDYKASMAAKSTTQAHSNPGNYLHWAMMGDVNFTTEWQHFSADVDVTAAMAKGDNGNGSGDGLFSIAFNLQEEKSAVDYYFDNFGVWYKLPIIDGINAAVAEKNAEGIFNLNGQKVMKAQKGLYIKNGKKVVIK